MGTADPRTSLPQAEPTPEGVDVVVGPAIPRSAVGARTAKGAALGLLRFSLQIVVGAVASIILTRLFTPADFGLYAIIASITVTPALFLGGLSFALVAEQRRVERQDVAALFWFLLLFATVAALVVVVIAFLFVHQENARFLLLSLAVWLVLNPLRWPAEFQLYRQIKIGQVALIEACELGGYQLTVIACAFAGLGVHSFGYGLVAGAVGSFVCAQGLNPWRPSRPILRAAFPWLKRGLHYQAQASLSVAKDRLTLPALALVASTAVVGWFGWAYNASAIVLSVATLANQALFAGLSYIRTEKEALADAVSLATRLLGLFLIGFGAVLAGSIQPIIATVFSPRWLPATHSFWLLSVATVTMAVALPLTQLARIDGRVNAVTRWQLGYLLVIWGFGIPIAYFLGAGGLALAYAVGSLIYALWSHLDSRRLYRLRFVVAITCYVLAGALAVASAYLVAHAAGNGWRGVLLAPVAGAAVYLLAVVLLHGRSALADVREAWALIRQREQGSSALETV